MKFFIFFLFISKILFAGNNLEEYAQDFVLDTKKIELASYPLAFNPSIVEWQGKLLLSFRIMHNSSAARQLSSSSCDSRIGLVFLDESFTPACEPQILNLKAGMHSEDARLLVIADRLYLVYSGNSNKIIDDEGFRMYVAELSFDGSTFSVIQNECMAHFEDSSKNKREKNWVPFAYVDELYFAYSIKPHRILKPLLDGSKACTSKYSSYPSIVWEWGELRGGTPALPFEDHYLAFFHSVQPMATEHSQFEVMPHYFIGAYLFNNYPPFKITQVSPEPIIGKGFYHGRSYEPYWHPVQVVFPCGFIYDEKHIWILIGRQDHEMWVVKLDKKGFLESLIQVSTFSHGANEQ